MAAPKGRACDEIDGDDTPDDGNGFKLEEVLRLGGTKVSERRGRPGGRGWRLRAGVSPREHVLQWGLGFEVWVGISVAFLMCSAGRCCTDIEKRIYFGGSAIC